MPTTKEAGPSFRRIYLIGYMGSGKSTVGRRLASRLGCPFIDLDACIEQREGKTVAEIFATHGEEYFREKERDCLREVSENTGNAVISVGGGTPCFFDNMDYMNARGVTVYLKLSPAALLSRLRPGLAKRPLLAGKNEQELLEYIGENLAKRECYYSRAQITADGVGTHLDDMVRRIAAVLEINNNIEYD